MNLCGVGVHLPYERLDLRPKKQICGVCISQKLESIGSSALPLAKKPINAKHFKALLKKSDFERLLLQSGLEQAEVRKVTAGPKQ
jgi:hypothetical protein